MKFWFSGEIQEDVADAYRAARRDVEAALNEALEGKDYGAGVKGWDFLAMIREDNDPAYNEVKDYDKREKSFEFRLKVSHAGFKAGDESARRALIVESLLRSVEEARLIAPQGINLDQLKEDMLGVARSKQWIVNN